MGDEVKASRLRAEHFFTSPPQRFLDHVREMVHDSVDQSIKDLRQTLEKDGKGRHEAVTKARPLPHPRSPCPRPAALLSSW